MLYREGNTIKVGFQPVVPPEMEGSLQANQVEVKVKEEPSEEESTLHYHPLDLIQIPPRITMLMMRW